MERDRESIGLNSETQAILAELEARGWFLEGQDVARFCMAYAIRAKVPEGARRCNCGYGDAMGSRELR